VLPRFLQHAKRFGSWNFAIRDRNEMGVGVGGGGLGRLKSWERTSMRTMRREAENNKQTNKQTNMLPRFLPHAKRFGSWNFAIRDRNEMG
jgi:hypothetical protein